MCFRLSAIVGRAAMRCLAILLCWAAVAHSAESSRYPYVYLQYSPAFDEKYCPSGSGITPEWVQSAQGAVSRLQKAWDDDSPALLDRVVRLIKPFRSTGEVAALFLCRKQKNTAFPLLLSAWPFIPEAMAGKPLPPSEIRFVAFHEILHRFVVENIDYRRPTPLLSG
jgi:hypothetical protein